MRQKTQFSLRLSLLATLALVPSVCFATANYEYGPDEYVTIVKGLSPDGGIAITAHGEGIMDMNTFTSI